MIFAFLVLLSALSISAVAAWFSITGLIAIFPLYPVSIFIMGVVLEVGKLVTASWLYRKWYTAPFMLKCPLSMAVIVLMFITSMGIFGYLSKMHVEQNAPIVNNELKIERLEDKIVKEKNTIEDTEKIITQLDSSVNTLIEYDKISGKTGAIAVRLNQKEERKHLNKIIKEANDKIDTYKNDILKYQTEVKEVELEIGPIKYIVELIFDSMNKSNMQTAVTAIILILVFVFDPLAVMLVIAGNISIIDALNKKEKKKDNKPINNSESVLDNLDVSINDIENFLNNIDENKETGKKKPTQKSTPPPNRWTKENGEEITKNTDKQNKIENATDTKDEGDDNNDDDGDDDKYYLNARDIKPYKED